MRRRLTSAQIDRLSRIIAPQVLDQKSTVYGLKTIGSGTNQRPRGRENWPDDYEMHLTDEPCAVFAAGNPREQSLGTQPRMVAEWEIYFKSGTALDEKFIVKVTTLGNRTFRLIGPMTASFEVLRIYSANEIR